MIRQARTYFVGAMSGATLIAIAIAAFAVLVSTQVFGDWPVAGLVAGGKEAAVSTATPVGGGGPAATPAGVKGAAVGAAAGKGGAGTAGGKGGGGATGRSSGGSAQAPGDNGGGGGEGAAPGGGGGSAPVQSPSGGSGGGGGAASSGGGSGGTTKTSSPSAQVTGTVNETVNKVDEATGGAVGETGVTQTTEGVVNGVAGPESVVGKTVDEATNTVEGIVGK